MFAGYFAWHYSYAYVDGYRIFIDGTRFLVRYFSFKRLASTFMRPLGRAAERGMMVRTASRFYGMIVRGIIMGTGVVCIALWWGIVLGAAIVWPFLPIVTAGGLAASFIGLSFAP
jgi:hypothetical protein